MTRRTAAVSGLRRIEHMMDAPIVVDVRDGGVYQAIERSVLRGSTGSIRVFSTYKDDSEITGWIGRRELALADADPDVRDVLARCESLRVETGGFFDANARGYSIPRASSRAGRSSCARRSSLRPGCVTRDQRRRRHPPRGRRAPGAGRRVGIHIRSSTRASQRSSRSGRRARDVGDVRARRARLRPPHGRGRQPASSRSRSQAPTSRTADAYATAAFAMGARAGPRGPRGSEATER